MHQALDGARRCSALGGQHLLRAPAQLGALSAISKQAQKYGSKVLGVAAHHGLAALKAGDDIAKVFHVWASDDGARKKRRLEDVVSAARNERAAHEGDIGITINCREFPERIQQQDAPWQCHAGIWRAGVELRASRPAPALFLE